MAPRIQRKAVPRSVNGGKNIKMTPRVSVSVLTYTAVKQAKACIASLLRQTEPFKLILTANGNPEAASYFTDLAKEFANISVIVNATNEGFIAPNTRAFSQCDTELFLMLNDDAILPPDALHKLIEPFDRFPKAALSGPKDDFQTLLPSFHGTKGPNFEYLNGACLMCKTAIVAKHGLFDPHLSFAYAEDSELSLRMREQGYTLHKVDFKLQHEIGATSRHVKEVRAHQEANHAFCRNRWAHYLRVRRMDYPIVIKRTAAHGDVLLTTPIIRALRVKHPLSPIHVETQIPHVFARNPHVASVAHRLPRMPDALIYNLDGAYESLTNRHIVQAYADKCGLSAVDDKTDFYLSAGDEARAARLMPDGDWIAVHSGPSTWRSKEWPQDRFSVLIHELRSLNYKIVLVGNAGKHLPSDIDQRGQTTIHEMGALIKRAKLFIGIDSLPLHISQSVGTDTIGLFGITDPKYILTSGSHSIGVCGTTESFGLRHRKPGTTHVDDGGAAMDSITTAAVLAAVHEITAMETLVK